MTESVHYFLRMYGIDSTIREPTEDLKSIRRHTTDSEKSFASCIENSDYFYGNAQADDEKISIFVKGLLF